MASLISIYDGAVSTDFLKKVETATLEIAREIFENELETVPHHDARKQFAATVLTVTDPSAVRRIALLINPGDAVDQSINTDDGVLKLAIWAVWNDVGRVF